MLKYSALTGVKLAHFSGRSSSAKIAVTGQTGTHARLRQATLGRLARDQHRPFAVAPVQLVQAVGGRVALGVNEQVTGVNVTVEEDFPRNRTSVTRQAQYFFLREAARRHRRRYRLNARL